MVYISDGGEYHNILFLCGSCRGCYA